MLGKWDKRTEHQSATTVDVFQDITFMTLDIMSETAWGYEMK